MNTDLAIVLALLVAAIAMFAINKPRMDAVGLLMLTGLPLTGVISMGDSLAGFSDPNIVLLGALFVIGEGLVRTGVAQRLGDWLLRTAGTSETRLLVLLMAVVGTLGAFMSSTGVVAIFIPVALRIAQGTGTAPSQLMMPLSVAALISGMLSLVATAPNLVVNSELVRHGEAGFTFFTFTPFGIPVLILGILYMLFARRWLSTKDERTANAPQRVRLVDWIERYKLSGREARVRVMDGSSLVGRTLEEANLRSDSGANIVAVERPGRFSREVFSPVGKTVLQADDILLVDVFASKVDVPEACARLSLEALPLSGAYFADRAEEIGMAEVMVAADSDLVGRTVREAGFRTRYRLTVIGLRHGKTAVESSPLTETLRVGDTLLVIGSWKKIDRLAADTTNLVLLNLPAERADVLPAPGKALPALACLVIMVGLMVSGVVPNVQAALIACLLMGALRCIDLDSAYRSIHWKSLILIVGMLPFSIALQKTGGVDLAADGLMALTAGLGTHGVLACLFLITAVLGLFISNTATAVLMAPVALAIASDLHASPYPFAMIVALAASTAFMTPISSPVNTLVVAPGNYGFGDFVRVGVPLSIIVMIVSVLLVPWVLPLYAK
jgi:di/tricarboxylate transporter